MTSPSMDLEIRLLLESIFEIYKSDFRDYSTASLRRRLSVALQKFSVPTISRLQEKVIREPETYSALLQYLTVSVSDLFRDPTYFAAVRDQVIPVLRTYPSFKIWIAGCGTGEEVYSMAILLAEENLLQNSIIYGTDINPLSLERAKEGQFSLDRYPGFAANYKSFGGKRNLSFYFHKNYENFSFDRKFKDNLVFADHSLATDAVFSEVHFVSCRNVLIYFNRELQDRAVHLFKDSLTYRGFLGLGSKESLRFSKWADSYETISANEKIYRRRGKLNEPLI